LLDVLGSEIVRTGAVESWVFYHIGGFAGFTGELDELAVHPADIDLIVLPALFTFYSV
jgi:hypothetical protein